MARRFGAPAPEVSERCRGFLAALGPGLVLLLRWLHEGPLELDGPAQHLVNLVAIVSAALLSGGGLAMSVAPGLGRALVALGLALFWAGAAPALSERPGLTLALLIATVALAAWVWPPSSALPQLRGRRRADVASAAALGAVLVWFCGALASVAHDPLGWGAVAASLSLALALGWRWAWGARHERPRRFVAVSAMVAGVVALSATLATLGPTLETAAATVGALGALGIGLAAWRSRHSSRWEAEVWWEPLFHQPARLLVGTFLVCCALGGLVLSLPACARDPAGISALDAFFTAFSATCVTGLATVDPATAFSGLGHVVILVLIQVGGLGIMTFSTAAFALLGRRMSMRHEASVSHLLSDEDRSMLHLALRRMLKVTALTELAGALVLALLFLRAGDGPGEALWRGLFTSVSAYCNAGFALQSGSLVLYQSDPLVLHVVALLVIVGGLGPLAVTAIPALVRRRPVSLQNRLVLATTAALLVIPAVFFLIVEVQTLGSMSALDRLSNAWFLSASLRTAGFSSIDLTAVAPATFTLMLVLMFIGGSPGSTAGGLKTATLAVLCLAIPAAIRGQSELTAFGFRVPQAVLYRSVAILAVGLLSILVALVSLTLTQSIPFEAALFEVVSALGTVGLTVGGTPALDGVGKVIIMACMFAGRVGPLTLFLVFKTERVGRPWVLPEQSVAVS